MQQQFIVSDEFANIRIDRYLVGVLSDYSRSYLQKLLKESAVWVNGSVVKSNYKVLINDRVLIELPESIEPEILAEDLNLDILYEDLDIILINKRKGMVVHPSAGHYSGTLVNGLMEHCKGQLSGINGMMRPGIVHRIDMDTTGVLIACKNDPSHQEIASQLKAHSITRKYHAIVHGNLTDDQGTIEGAIGRHPIHRKKMSVNAKNGKDAVTHYRVLKRFSGYTYIECQLETGRTHQIRVHLASIHHPLLGDTTYGFMKAPFDLQGQTLHAKVLGIIHPRTKEYMEFEAPLPDYFERLLKKLDRI